MSRFIAVVGVRLIRLRLLRMHVVKQIHLHGRYTARHTTQKGNQGRTKGNVTP